MSIYNQFQVIYKITNHITNKVYVGSTVNVIKRHTNHINQLINLKHHSIKLQNSWNKHGENAFTFNILEYCHPQKCIEREQRYINTLNPEYNICRIAGNTFGYRHTIEAKRKVAVANMGNTYHCDGNFIFKNKD